MSDKNLTVKSLIEQLSRRVAELEREVTELKCGQTAGPAKDWRRTVGMFAGDEVMKRIDAAGQAVREAERRRARQSRARSARAK
jgi:cell division protein FtsB